MPDQEKKRVVIYTDGACSGNPGPGGYGCVLMCKGVRKEISAGYRLTTNNRMEIMAVIAGLSMLKVPCDVTIYSDSRYVVDAWEKGWVKRWERQRWMRTKKEQAANTDLWARLLELSAPHEVRFVWVPGHAGRPENERCDELSRLAAQQETLNIDEGYEGKRGTGYFFP